MPYDPDSTWRDWALQAQIGAHEVLRQLNAGLDNYNEWQTFRAARTNAQIATDLGKTEAEIADLDSCYAAYKEIYDFADNVASPTQGDRLYSMRRFS